MARPKDLKSASALAVDKPHGTRIKYVAGCRCADCRAANTGYELRRAQARREGDWNGLVSAEPAKEYINFLSRRGMGRRAVSEKSGVCSSTIQKIKSGEKKQIRAATEKKIFIVDLEISHIVPAEETWKRINLLLSEGFTEEDLARRFGSKSKYPRLQYRKNYVLSSTALKVEKFYNEVMFAGNKYEESVQSKM
ncbi:MAG: hypothetical protein WA584_23665 [Pyrinomonadaceae bacterium]